MPKFAPREAPRIADIIDDPAKLSSRQDVLCFSRDGGPVETATEAQALAEYGRCLKAAGAIISAHAMSDRQRQLSRLIIPRLQHINYLGGPEFTEAAHQVALRFQEEMAGRDTIYVGVAEHESSSMVLGAVRKQLAALDKRTNDKIIPVDLVTLEPFTTSEARDINEQGVIILDDWAVSATQAGEVIDTLVSRGISRKNMQIQLFSAPERYLDKGIAGVECNTVFYHDPLLSRETGVAVTGAHCSPDYGYAHHINAIIPTAKDLAAIYCASHACHSAIDLQKPLLAGVCPPYK